MAGITPRYDLGTIGVEDMVNLPDLSEGALLWNLRTRYEKELIYTYTGGILVAVNPYRFFDVYGTDNVKRYSGQVLGTLPPHLFAVGNETYVQMQRQNASQVIIISGESGSGKTESTKLLLRYLAAVNRSGSNVITEQIVEANPLLESFGNAKTTRNDNSSRFGKYVEVTYKGGSIEGAKISQYLLEKSRVVTHGSDERSYHIFYEMLAGMDHNQKQKYGLKTANDYFYLNQGGLAQMSLKNDRDDYKTLVAAMDVINFTHDERHSILSILAAVLHMGNVIFKRKLPPDDHSVEIAEKSSVKWVSQLLQLDEQWLIRGMSMKVTEARQERLLTPFSMEQAIDTRDAISKGLYSNLFDWLVHRVNKIIYKEGKNCSIAILDIFGFEEFAKNSFEQLCINYANETLQYYFNKHIFKLEQSEYEKEGIDWQFIEFEDNQPTINLIARKPSGIIYLLDDESNFPQGTDMTFLDKCHYHHTDNPLYTKPRLSAPQFIIRHYAGNLTYTVTNFLEKNKDTLRNDVLDLMCQSGNPLIASIFREARDKKTVGKSTGRSLTMKPRTATVAASFHESLLQLIDNMSKCNPFFVRCVKPNSHKSPMRFDMDEVLTQLRYTGMLETIKIRKMGYPVRLPFPAFVARHHFLLSRQKIGESNVKKLCTLIMKSAGAMYNENFQLGQTKVFMKEAFYKQLEILTKRTMVNALVIVQKHVRGYIARRQYVKRRAACIVVQKNCRMFLQRRRYQRARRAVIKLQALIRMRLQRRRYFKVREQARNKRAAELQRKRLDDWKTKERNGGVVKVSSFRHLEVPAQLAMLFSQVDDWQPAHTERNIAAFVGKVAESEIVYQLPPDIDQYTLSRMVSLHFKTNRVGMVTEPVKEPFLPKSSEADAQESLMLFKLILRFMNDATLSPKRECLLGDYIIQKGIANERLRDEIYCQLVNQTWRNGGVASVERGWLLMAGCLSAFPPSHQLSKYLLKYVSDHAYNGYKWLCQSKVLQCNHVVYPLTRHYPPTMLEWRVNRQRAHMALHLHYADGTIGSAAVTSWTTCEDMAAYMITQNRNITSAVTGWSVCMREPNRVYEAGGYEFVLDLIGEMEVPAHFPSTPADFLISQTPTNEKEKKNFENTPHNPDYPRTYLHALDHGMTNRETFRSQAVFVAGQPNAYLQMRVNGQQDGVSPIVISKRPTSAVFTHEATSPPLGKSYSTHDLSHSKLNERYFVPRNSSPQNRPFDSNARDKIQRRLRKQSLIWERGDVASNASEMSQFIDDVFDGVLDDGTASDLRDGAAMVTALRGLDYVNEQTMNVGAGDQPGTTCQIDSFLTSLIDDCCPDVTDLCDVNKLVLKLQGGGAGVKDGSSDRPSSSIALPARPTTASSEPAFTSEAAKSGSAVPPPPNLKQKKQRTDENLSSKQQALLEAAVQEQTLQNELLQQKLQGELLKQQLYQVQALNQSQGHVQNKPPIPQASVAPHRPQTTKVGAPKRTTVVQISDKVETIPQSKTIIAEASDAAPRSAPSPRGARKLTSAFCDHKGENGTGGTVAPVNDITHPAPSTSGAHLASILSAKFSKSTDDLATNRAKTVRVANVQWPPRKNSDRKPEIEVGRLVIVTEGRRRARKLPHPHPPPTQNHAELHEMTMELIRSRSTDVTDSNDDTSAESSATSPARSDQVDGSTPSTASTKIDMKARARHLEAALSKPSSSSAPTSSEPSPTKIVETKRTAPSPPPLSVRTTVERVVVEPTVVVVKKTQADLTVVKERKTVSAFKALPPEPEPDFSDTDLPTDMEPIHTKLLAPATSPTYTYTRTPWQLHIRKEFFTPTERVDNPVVLALVFCQIVLDVLMYPCIRIAKDERAKMRNLLGNHSVTIENYSSSGHKSVVKKSIIDQARDWPCYFSRFYNVSCGGEYSKVELLGISHTAVRLVRRHGDYVEKSLAVVHLIRYDEILGVELIRYNQLTIRCRAELITVYCRRASQIKRLIEAFCIELEKGNVYVRAMKDYRTRDATLLCFKKGDVIKVTNKDMHLDEGWLYGTLNGQAGMFPIEHVVNLARHDVRRNSAVVRPWSTSAVTGAPRKAFSNHGSVCDDMSVDSSVGLVLSTEDGKFSMLEFALQHYRQALNRYEMLRKEDGSIRGTFKLLERLKIGSNRKKSKKGGDWGWKEEVEMIKWSKSPIQASLLRWHGNEKLVNKASLECFISIMRYMGDYPLAKNQKDIDTVYVILLACHQYPQLKDEVYCQLCKQTTSNRSVKPDSATRGWRLFSILAAYFDCSASLKPYLLKYLQDAALDGTRIHHSISSVALQNVRKTLVYGGRKNVPNKAEVEALSRGRLTKRQMFLLPGGIPVTLNLKPVSVVTDVINEICEHLNVTSAQERAEYTIYYVVEKEHLHSPLRRDEYVFDVTTELANQKKEFHLLFQRSTWYYDVRLDYGSKFVDVMYNQCLPTYQNGNLVVCRGGQLTDRQTMEISRLAALQHRARDKINLPSMGEVHDYLPRGLDKYCAVSAQGWVNLVHKHLRDLHDRQASDCKADFLDILVLWPLFGSKFFHIKNVFESPVTGPCLMAVNKKGVYLLDDNTHEALVFFPIDEVLNTRRYIDDKKKYLDLKCGNLLMQKLTRFETDQNDDISRIISQYIRVTHQYLNQEENFVES